MLAVIFEVQPRKGRFDDYLELAKRLKPRLEVVEGFIDNERFGSRKTAGRILSLSIWRDEEAVVRWRTHGEHHVAQEKGRNDVFEDYRLRVGEIIADSARPMVSGEQQGFDETGIGEAKACTITELTPGESNWAAQPDLRTAQLRLSADVQGLVDHEVFESIYNPGKLLILASWRDRSPAMAWSPTVSDGDGKIRHRAIRIIRDYGMLDRREAPQFFPPLQRSILPS